jgi:hypothetical protein
MIPATIRNRNPGGMYPGPSAKKFGSTRFETLRSKDGTHKIASFPTHLHGAAALFDLLDRSYTGKTIEQAVEKWCGGHYVSTYLKVLQQKGNIPPNLALTKSFLRDHGRSIDLVRAMSWQEAGQDYPLDQQGWLEAHAMAFAGGKVAPEFSPTNDVPSPKPETRQAETVKEVAKVAVPLAVGSGGAAVSTQAPSIPIPPAPDLSPLSAWQGVIETGKGLTLFAVNHLHWIAAAGLLYWLVCCVWPKRQA